MNDKKTNYWGFRINWRNEDAFNFLKEEINEGRLRQGWGSCKEQKLPHPTLKKGEQGNIPIYKKVKKGDYLLIPHVPSYPFVTIVRATQNFNDDGYNFQIDPTLQDYGHIFPIEKVKKFARGNKNVHADIRTSLRNPARFWSMKQYEKKIQELLSKDEEDLCSSAQQEELAIENLRDAMSYALDEDKLRKHLNELFEHSLQSIEWEFALRKALELIFPHCRVDRIGGKTEKQHGCDLAIFIPTLKNERQYVIGIQVKDFKNRVKDEDVDGIIKQISKANEFWKEEDGYILVDKYLIIIDSSAENNPKLETEAKKNGIRVLYKDDVLDLLTRAAKIQMAKNLLTL